MSECVIRKLEIGLMAPDLVDEVDSFIEANNGTIFHEIFLNKATADTCGTVLTYYLAYKKNVLAGVFPCHTTIDGFVRRSFSNLTSHDLPYGGWVYDKSTVSIEQLHKGLKVKFNEALSVSTNIELSKDSPCLDPSSRHFSTAKTVILGLAGKSEEDLFSGFTHSQRNKIRKAAKLGVVVTPINPGNIEAFYGLLVELKDKINKTYKPQEYFGSVFEHYHRAGRACCLMAQYGGEDISTLIVLANKAYATLWYGGRSMGIPKNLYQNELLIWEAIRWARGYGSRYFDLCTVDEERHPNLARMKLSFSKEIYPYYRYVSKGFAYKALNKLQSSFKTP